MNKVIHLLVCTVALIAGGTTTHAAQKTKAQLAATIQSQLPSSGQGIISAERIRSVLQDMVDSDQQIMLVNAQKGTSYTFSAADQGKIVTFQNSSAISATLPSGNDFGQGYTVYVKNVGPGLLTITPIVSTINGGGSLTLNSNESALIASDSSNNYIFC